MSNSTSNLDLISQSQAQKEVTANALFDAMSMAATYGYLQSTSGLLAWGYYGGNVTLTDGSLLAVANSIINIPANGTNYLVASKATGVVSVSQSITNWNDLANYWRLYLITSSNVSVTGYTDNREFGNFQGWMQTKFHPRNKGL